LKLPETSPREPWWREWPLAVAVITLTLALLGQGWIATALDRSAQLIALPRTNVLLGSVHLLLFGAYLMLMFDR